MKFYISDLHIGHKNCLEFDKRPFKTLEEMHETIINRWNSVVTETDDVYVVGDFFWKQKFAEEILPRLKGNIYLIRGNHDQEKEALKSRCVWIKDYAEIKDNGQSVILCHYPIAHWKKAEHGSIHIYGHLHDKRPERPFGKYKKLMKKLKNPYECYNVGCMLHNYTPVTLEELRVGNLSEFYMKKPDKFLSDCCNVKFNLLERIKIKVVIGLYKMFHKKGG